MMQEQTPARPKKRKWWSKDSRTEITGVHENLPSGVSPADNELGWSISLRKLAKLVEETS